MSDLIWLSAMQMRRIEPYFPLSHGVPRVDAHPGARGAARVAAGAAPAAQSVGPARAAATGGGG